MASTLIAIADAVVTRLTSTWQPVEPNAVTRVYLPDIPDPKDFTEGTQIWVVPGSFSQADTATRAQDRNSFTVYVLFASKFPAETSGEPTAEWMDEQIGIVEDLWRDITDARAVPLFPDPLNDVIPGESRMQVLYDEDLLRENKIFHAGIEIVYERDEE
ncbi:MAG: hypothetical protein EKK55_03605 [Rhodocyclaceae bacterium]|nr:MAG: hypothetical protein EKK55_03605 [Rhodocyclaceae bacterium]